ncbi:MAG: hypothetical protein AABY86_04105 [Bdellovibrionota bacterium]
MGSILSVVYVHVLLFLVGCQQASIKITSVPTAAMVSMYNPVTSTYQQVGVTPINLSAVEGIPPEIAENDIWSIRLDHSGYVIEHIFVEKSLNQKIEVNAKLKVNAEWTDKQNTLLSDMADWIGITIQRINMAINNKKFKEALDLTEQLIARYPKAAIFYDIKGTIYYLSKELDYAISSYRKSLELNPDNVETRKLLKKLTVKQQPGSTQ